MKNVKILSLGVISLVFLVIDWILINSAFTNQRALAYWFWPIFVSALVITFLTFFFSANFHRSYSLFLALFGAMGYFLIMPIVSYERFFPLIFTLIIVGLLRTFAFLFNWLTTFFTWILFKPLLAFNFFRLVLVPVEVKKLEI